ncbi:MAG TPA: hypothetical protein ENJ42_08535 [Hellea balneolensis]|uniref:Uncharacterized protein n=1 Tax=Hellea balneolensis TaxID=287478 RepID=A0A7C5LW17_9PROT|nr:hypothetical protein [Hellea balneolensis]
MTYLDPIKLAGIKSKSRRPYFFESKEAERVMAITMAVAQELAVVRARLDTVERILEKKGIMTQDEIEKFEPDDKAAAEGGAWTQEYIARILRIVQQEAEAVEIKDEPSAEEQVPVFAAD